MYISAFDKEESIQHWFL